MNDTTRTLYRTAQRSIEIEEADAAYQNAVHAAYTTLHAIEKRVPPGVLALIFQLIRQIDTLAERKCEAEFCRGFHLSAQLMAETAAAQKVQAEKQKT